MQLAYNVRNVHRAVGTRLSAHITRRYGMDQLPPGQITVRLRGSAGQSLGAFAVQGLRLEVFGDANDYVGKGLSGGTIIVRPLVSSPIVDQRERDHRQHLPVRRHGRQAVRGRPRRRALRGAQLGCGRGGRGLRRQRLRVHDRRRGGGARGRSATTSPPA